MRRFTNHDMTPPYVYLKFLLGMLALVVPPDPVSHFYWTMSSFVLEIALRDEDTVNSVFVP